MMEHSDKSRLNNSYRSTEHPCVISGYTIINHRHKTVDAHGKPIDKDVLYAEETLHISGTTGDYYRIDDQSLVWGNETVAKNSDGLVDDYACRLIDKDNEDIVYEVNQCEYMHRDDTNYSEFHDQYIIADDSRWSEFHQSFIHENAAIWHDGMEDYYHEEYREEFFEHHELYDGNASDEHINDYHGTPDPRFINEHQFQSGWFVGFEVEKTHLDNGADSEGDSVDPCNFFAGWETDSSCGVEGISNVYNIDDPQLLVDIKNASHINSETNISCGGHINISYRSSRYTHNMLTDDAGQPIPINTEMLKKYMGIIYAMFPQRLIRSYCNSNKKLHKFEHIKYSPMRDCRGRVEIRLFNRVANSQTLINRVKFLQVFLNAVEKLEVQLNKEELLANTPRFPLPEIADYMKENRRDDYDYITCIDFTMNPSLRYAKYILNACLPILSEIYSNYRSIKLNRLSELVAHTYAFTDFITTDKNPKATIARFCRED
jgi:hypothetical protein